MPKYECIFSQSGSVERYQNLRFIPEAATLEIGRIISSQSLKLIGLNEALLVCDAGAGTGRFALPIARSLTLKDINLKILAIDLSDIMLQELKSKWEHSNIGASLKCINEDLQGESSIKENSVHAVYTVATFHILEHWRDALDNLIKMLVPGGILIFIQENNQFMHQTEGFENDCDFNIIDPTLKSFMEFYHEQRELNNEPYVPSELRYSNMGLAIDYLKKIGLEELNVEVDQKALRWEKPHTYDEILLCFRNREMTTWGSDLSKTTRNRIAGRLEQWVIEKNIKTDNKFFLPAVLKPFIFRKSN